MYKINYDNSEFINEFQNLVVDYFNKENRLNKIESTFKKLFGKSYTICYSVGTNFYDTAIYKFDQLINIAEQFNNKFLYEFDGEFYFDFRHIKRLSKVHKKFSPSELKKYNRKKERLRALFPYSSLQPMIAKLFRKYKNELKLSTCFYCNIDYINSFNSYSEYKDIVDFFNNASRDELITMFGDKKINIDNIKNSFFSSESDIVKNTYNLGKEGLKKLKNDLYLHTHDHFTLDHFIDKGTFPILALSLYNLVPSCYTCNSKLKKEKNLIKNNSSLLSPTDDNFDFDSHVKFKMFMEHDRKYINTEQKISQINSEKDFIIKLTEKSYSAYGEFIRCFKLEGRYQFHKKTALDLIDKRKSYPDKHIYDMVKVLSTSNDPIEEKKLFDMLKRDIYGKEVFDGEIKDVPLTKLKRDIAENIGIK